MAEGNNGESTYRSRDAAFYKMAAVPMAVELFLIGWAVHGYQSVPAGGDPTLRYVSMGIPGFWAVLLAILIAVSIPMFTGQSVALTKKAFIYRRGRFSIVIPWDQAMVTDSAQNGGRSFTVSSPTASVQIRAFLFPEFAEMESRIGAFMKRREAIRI